MLQRQRAISRNVDDLNLPDHGNLSTEGICSDTGNFDAKSYDNDAVYSLVIMLYNLVIVCNSLVVVLYSLMIMHYSLVIMCNSLVVVLYNLMIILYGLVILMLYS